MNTHMSTGLLICVLSQMMAGCSNYYRVTDPGSGKTYYTTDIDERSGRLKFKDEKTGSTVTLHSAEVSDLSEAEYRAEVKVMGPIPPPVATGPSAKTEPQDGAR